MKASHFFEAKPSISRNGSKSTKQAFAALALLTIIWGYNWVAMKVGIRYCEPFAFTALRLLPGSIVIFLLAALLKYPLKMPAPKYTITISILQTGGFSGLTIWALESGGAGKVAVLAYIMPFWVLIMAWPILGEKIQGLQWVATGSALIGLFLIISPWHMTDSLQSSIIAVIASFLWGVGSILIKLMQRKQPINILSFTAWQLLIGGSLLAMVAILRFNTQPIWSSGAFIIALVFNILIATALGWILWIYALKNLSAGTVGVGSLAIPVVGVLSAWIQLHEQPDLWEALGMLLIIVALTILTVRGILMDRRV